jgi:hypothetical protein
MTEEATEEMTEEVVVAVAVKEETEEDKKPFAISCLLLAFIKQKNLPEAANS